MKTNAVHFFCRFIFLSCVAAANAQTFTILHSFTYGSDGAYPYAVLILGGNTLYGTALSSDNTDNGTVFSVNINGTGFTTLHDFTTTSGSNFTNSDGDMPMTGLIISANTLYGTASSGGSLGYGTVFAVNTNGTGFTTLHSFTDGGDGTENSCRGVNG